MIIQLALIYRTVENSNTEMVWYVLSVPTVLQFFHSKSVLWIRKYFFRSRIREAIKLRVRPDRGPDIFMSIEKEHAVKELSIPILND